MPIFQNKSDKLVYLNEKKIDLERDIQKLTEKNLELIFNLKFVSGSLNQEFSVRVNEQDFYIDTLAYDESTKALVIIEYKKDRSISVIDQGFAYLSAMLRNKADFILEINHRLGKNWLKDDINWEQSMIIFISPEFTNYQKNAINFRDLPISLYEVKTYEGDLVSYSPIIAYRTSESINKFSKDITVTQVSKEIKVYDREDLLKSGWTDTNKLLNTFEEALHLEIPETKIKYTKLYIAYMSIHGKNFVEIVPQQQGLKVYFRFYKKDIKSELEIEDCSKKGHWTNGNSYTTINSTYQITETIRLVKESYAYIHKK